MVGTMLYGYKARTWVLISTDRSTMGTTLEEIGAPWIYINLSSGHSLVGVRMGLPCHDGEVEGVVVEDDAVLVLGICGAEFLPSTGHTCR